MLDGIDALFALQSTGTVTEAATRLRLTQSAVSKRLQALADAVGFALVEPDGRRLRLTPRAIDFLERARPLVAELRGLTRLRPRESPARAHFALALADSIASSWGPAAVARALRGLGGVDLELHAHRSVLVIEAVRLGRYDLGLCTELPTARDLVQELVIAEPMVLVRDGRGPLITIEPGSATFRAIHGALRQHHPALLARPQVPVETFTAAAQMARAGFGTALIPLGLARETGLRFRTLAHVERRIVLLARKTVAQHPAFAALRSALTREAAGGTVAA
jgi:DNA-binding transcriptional LysR family regulator